MAWEQVHDNAGACGMDRMTVEIFQNDSQNRLLAVNERLREDLYQPKPVKRTWIPKAGSAQMRPLGIPMVTDRVVQTALKMVLEPIFEREFAPHSYGFRPGLGCKDALRRVEVLLIKEGYVHGVDIDIKGYFDSIPQDKLLERVGEKIADGRVIELLRKFLTSGVMEKEEIRETVEGTPQGGVISPLLANIYLDPLDWLMAKSGYEMVRYADDMVVLCRDAQTATNALSQVAEWMGQAGLVLHPEKTKSVDMGQPKAEFDFLGYRFYRSGKGELQQYVRRKSLKKMRETLKPLTRRSSGRSMATIIATLNPLLRGWYGYFKQVREEALDEVDGWVRARLRNILRHRQGLKGRANQGTHFTWKNDTFHSLGLFCLKQAKIEESPTFRTKNRKTNC
jgi:RNA-directed DNA polymerase